MFFYHLHTYMLHFSILLPSNFPENLLKVLTSNSSSSQILKITHSWTSPTTSSSLTRHPRKPPQTQPPLTKGFPAGRRGISPRDRGFPTSSGRGSSGCAWPSPSSTPSAATTSYRATTVATPRRSSSAKWKRCRSSRKIRLNETLVLAAWNMADFCFYKSLFRHVCALNKTFYNIIFKTTYKN